MEKIIDRAQYYKADYEGFAIFLITRAYNDLQINSSMFESVKGKLSGEVQIYLFKLLTAHLKETLKLLAKIKSSGRFNGIMTKWEKNPIVKKCLTDISDELENPNDYKNTINAKYLNFRNEVFHYGSNSNDFEEYKKIQQELNDKKLDVLIRKDNSNKYIHEIGVDIQISQGIFDEQAIEEVNNLKTKVQLILREILNDYLNEQSI